MIVLQDGVALGVSGSPSGSAGGALTGSYPNPTLAGTIAGAHTWSGAQTLSAGAVVATGQTVAGAAELTLAAASGQAVNVDIASTRYVQVMPSGGVYLGSRTPQDPGAGNLAIGGSSSATQTLYADANGTLKQLIQLTSGTLFVGYLNQSEAVEIIAGSNSRFAMEAFGSFLDMLPNGNQSQRWYFSKGTYIGDTPADPGANNCRIQGTLGIAGACAASAALTVTSTTLGFLPPVMTTTQKNAISSPAEGLMVYDSTLHAPCVYNGTSWKTVTIS